MKTSTACFYIAVATTIGFVAGTWSTKRNINTLYDIARSQIELSKMQLQAMKQLREAQREAWELPEAWEGSI